MNDTALSRSGESNPFGKCSEELKTVVPPEIKERFVALAVIKAGGQSEYLRELVMREVLGEFEIMRLRHSRGSRESGKGQE